MQVGDESVPGDSRFVGFVANAGAGMLLPVLDSPPQNAEDFAKLWGMVLKMSRTNIHGKDVKIGMGVRRWVWAPDDPRATC